MNNPKVEAIQNKRERHFASVFFAHDNWVHHPRAIYFHGGRYTADFWDGERKIYIEVVGTRQAFQANRYKYLYMLTTMPDLRLEFRDHKGNQLDPFNMRLRYPRQHKPYMSRDMKYDDFGIMPDGYGNAAPFGPKLLKILLSTNWTVQELERKIGIPASYVSMLVDGRSRVPGVNLIKIEYCDKIQDFIEDWEAHPEKYPARRGYAVLFTRSHLERRIRPSEYYCPSHPAGIYFDDVYKHKGKPLTTTPTTPPADRTDVQPPA